jgi:hypothetical protein
MWTARTEGLPRSDGQRVAVDLRARPAAFSEVVRSWESDADFRSWFNSILAAAPYSAFRWETPAVTSVSINRPFEFVLLDSPGLASRPDPNAFADHYAGGVNGVTVFPNLGGDATLIVPCPVAEASAYGHLASFVRLAPEWQRHALWLAVGKALDRRLGDKPVWLSTAGAGVSWLHVRLDDRPKYYGFAPYRRSDYGHSV